MKRLLLTYIILSTFSPLWAQYNLDTNWVSNESRLYNLNLEEIDIEIDETGDYYALLIGAADYQDDKIPDLENTISDASRLKRLLNDFYTFPKENTVFLKNPSKSELGKTFQVLAEKITANDNLLIFYAGHGEWNPNTRTGYWMLSDAKASDNTTWLSNSNLRVMIKEVNAKHVLLITDACFSGSLFRGTKATTLSREIDELHRLSSRKAMTSGNLKLVPDESVFIDYLVRRLGQNTRDHLTAERLFYSFKRNVILESPGQTPKYNVIADAGDDNGGEFVFIRKQH